MIYISGPGHGGPALVGNTYLEGTYSEVYPAISQDEAGLKNFSNSFLFPEEFQVMFHLNVRVPFMKAVNWDIH